MTRSHEVRIFEGDVGASWIQGDLPPFAITIKRYDTNEVIIIPLRKDQAIDLTEALKKLMQALSLEVTLDV